MRIKVITVIALLLAGFSSSRALGDPVANRYGTPLAAEDGTLRLGSVPVGYALSQGFSYARFEGRSVGVWEVVASATLQERYRLWYGQQWVGAHGRHRDYRFTSRTHLFGGQAVLRRTSDSALTAEYAGFRPRPAIIDLAQKAHAEVPGPATDTAVLSYTFLPSGRSLAARPLEYGVNALLTRADGDGRSSRALGLGGSVGMRLGRNLSGALLLHGFFERAEGLQQQSGRAFKMHGRAGLVYQPFSWAKLDASLDYFPSGLPFSGTPLAGLSSFMLYEPSSRIKTLHTNGLGMANLRLTLGTRF